MDRKSKFGNRNITKLYTKRTLNIIKKCITVSRNYTKYNYEIKTVNAQLHKHTKLLYSRHKVYSTSRLHKK